MLFKVPRPNGEHGHSFRPDAPDPKKPGRKYEQPCKHLGSPGNFLGVYETSPGLLEDASASLVFVEGVKKALSLIGAARAAGLELVVVAISGVWNWLSKGAPIPDMLALPVEGRSCEIVFDSDMLRNPNVQDATRRLAEYLTGRGAGVWVAYLRDGDDGSKTGADDFFAAGGTFKELGMLTRPYDPADFTTVRLNRSDELRAMVRYLWRRWHEGDWMRFVGAAERGNWARGHTARDTMEALIELAVRRGKPDARGLVVAVGLRALADKAAKTAPSVGKATRHLEADGQIEILPPKEGGKTRSYRLLVPRAAIYIVKKEDGEERTMGEPVHRCKGLRAPAAPRLRWSSPGRPRRREFEVVRGASRVRHAGHTPRNAVAEDLEARPYVKRLGPHRCAVPDALERAGGELHVEDLCEVLHRARPRDVRRRILKPLEEAGVIECEGDVVRLAADWLDRLEKERGRTGEVEQAKRQREKHREQSARFREHLKREKHPGPSRAGLEHMRRGIENREKHIAAELERQEKARAAELERKRFVKRFVYDRIRLLGRIRLELLQEVLKDAGGIPSYALPAAKSLGCTVKKLPEYGNREFVFAPREWGAEGAA